ncbi:MAG: GIY-YIG nuclease family protein [Cyclobacteriaceae bacterium]
MRAKGGYTYIVSNKHRTVLYIGVTNNLYSRVYEHKSGDGSGFTKKYKCTDLVYYEYHADIESAIHREKRLKKWNRSWKNDLITEFNPNWKDLFNDLEDMQ